MSAAIRPQLKDLHTCGFDARSSIDGKKQKALQPPMNASPGELRLWRKLNGLLSEEEKGTDQRPWSEPEPRNRLRLLAARLLVRL